MIISCGFRSILSVFPPHLQIFRPTKHLARSPADGIGCRHRFVELAADEDDHLAHDGLFGGWRQRDCRFVCAEHSDKRFNDKDGALSLQEPEDLAPLYFHGPHRVPERSAPSHAWFPGECVASLVPRQARMRASDVVLCESLFSLISLRDNQFQPVDRSGYGADTFCLIRNSRPGVKRNGGLIVQVSRWLALVLCCGDGSLLFRKNGPAG